MSEVTASSLATHPFLHGMAPEHLEVLASAARAVSFPARYRLFEEGGNATRYWLIQSGHVALDLYVPGDARVVIEHIGMGEILGWSWLFPPYQWNFGAVTASAVQAFEFDAPEVRAFCATDPVLGYDFTQRLLRVLAHRLQATRFRLASLDSVSTDRSA